MKAMGIHKLRHTKNAWPILILLLVLVLLSAGVEKVSGYHQVSDREVMVGDKLPSMSLLTYDGSSLEIPAQDGITVLLFWAMWSPRSEPAMNLWQKFVKDYADNPLTVVTVNSEGESLSTSERAELEEFIKENVIDLPVVLDDGLILFNEFAVKSVPTVFFLDSEGVLVHRYPSFPSSAPLDLKEELEIHLGLRERESEEEKEARGKLDYQPKNNALLHYNLGVQLQKKGFTDKAKIRYIKALQLDPEYADPLRTLEGIYFADGKTTETEDELKVLLAQDGLDMLVERIGEGEPIVIEKRKKIDAMERMRQLLGENAPEKPEVE